MTDVDLAGAAAIVGRGYSWFARNWRDLKHGRTGAPFPLPHVGAARGSRPRWTRAVVEAWVAGLAVPGTGQTAADLTQREPANDAAAQPPSAGVAALLAAAGG